MSLEQLQIVKIIKSKLMCPTENVVLAFRSYTCNRILLCKQFCREKVEKNKSICVV